MEFFDVVDVPEYLDDCPATRFLFETKDRIENFSTLEWLKTLDNDTLALITQYMETSNAMSDAEAIESTEMKDYAFLVGHCMAYEMGMPFGDLVDTKEFKELQESSMGVFNVFLVFESLRRKGLVAFKGNGKITEKNFTEVSQTELGRQLMEKEIWKKKSKK